MRDRAGRWLQPGIDVALVCLAAFAVRLGVAWYLGTLTQPELFEYDEMARNLLAGRGLTIRHLGLTYYSFAPPLLSWIIAGSYWLTGSIVPAMLVQITAGAALAGVVAAIAQRLCDRRLAALAAGVLVAVHPGLVVYTATKSHPLAFDALSFTLALLLFFRLKERPTFWRAAALGLVVGLGTLTRSTMLIFFPIGAVWMLATMWMHDRRAAVRALAVAGVAAFLVMLPWSIRDSVVHQRPLFLISTTGEDFWDGNNARATGHSYIDAEHALINSMSPEERADLKSQPDEIAQSQWFMRQAMTFIREHPGDAARLTAVKFVHFWWFAPQTGVTYPARWRQLYMAYYLCVLVLAGAGVRQLLRVSPSVKSQALLLGLFLLGLSSVQSLYYVEARHRWAIEPMVLALSGAGVAALAGRRPWPAPRAVS